MAVSFKAEQTSMPGPTGNRGGGGRSYFARALKDFSQLLLLLSTHSPQAQAVGVTGVTVGAAWRGCTLERNPAC